MPKVQHVWYVVYTHQSEMDHPSISAVELYMSTDTIANLGHIKSMVQAVRGRHGSAKNVTILSWTYLRSETVNEY